MTRALVYSHLNSRDFRISWRELYFTVTVTPETCGFHRGSFTLQSPSHSRLVDLMARALLYSHRHTRDLWISWRELYFTVTATLETCRSHRGSFTLQSPSHPRLVDFMARALLYSHRHTRDLWILNGESFTLQLPSHSRLVDLMARALLYSHRHTRDLWISSRELYFTATVTLETCGSHRGSFTLQPPSHSRLVDLNASALLYSHRHTRDLWISWRELYFTGTVTLETCGSQCESFTLQSPSHPRFVDFMARALLYSHRHTRDLWISWRELYFTVTVTPKTCGFHGESFSLQSPSHPRFVDFMARALLTVTVTPEICGFHGEGFSLQSPSHPRLVDFMARALVYSHRHTRDLWISWRGLYFTVTVTPEICGFHGESFSLQSPSHPRLVDCMTRALLYSHRHTRDLWISWRELYFTVTVTLETCRSHGESFTLQSPSHPRLVDFMARALLYSHRHTRDLWILWRELYFTDTVTLETCRSHRGSFTLQPPSHSRLVDLIAGALLYSHRHTRDLWISWRELYFTVTVTPETCGFHGESFTLQPPSHPRLVDFMARALLYSHRHTRDLWISWRELYFTATVTPETCGFHGESFSLQSP
ncbi:hypothetical protein RRG08_013788 [Elysia crispata]|uniref:Uncharacterized protein n=1 Tax=Elysia crispata TaxID=231223 RepID=A0AAE1EDX4_9GAST|nr:hypothetical protein RRG08_013788 [Elysia crispata]